MDRKSRNLTVYGKQGKSDETIPQIRFEGQWLKSVGFLAGDKIQLDYEENKIIITKLSENNE